MLKNVAILGGTPKQLERLKKSVNDSSVHLDAQIDDQPLASAALAVLAPDASEDLVHAAVSLATRRESLLYLLADAIDCREGLAPGSSRRVVEHAARFAEALNLHPNDRSTLERAALLRDLGKLRIPNEVLLKKDLMTYDEWATLQKHTRLGADIAAELDGLRDTEEIIRCHHESYDGDGYPERLEGEQIPFLARVLKIIDVYCAMTSPRHYRTGIASHKEAIDHIRAEQGKHFDPDLADVFISGKLGTPPVLAKPKPKTKPKPKPKSGTTKSRKAKKRP